MVDHQKPTSEFAKTFKSLKRMEGPFIYPTQKEPLLENPLLLPKNQPQPPHKAPDLRALRGRIMPSPSL